MPYGENDNHPLTNGTYNWHEDFGDEPSVEERYPDEDAPEDDFPEDDGQPDDLTEHQDFEQADEYFGADAHLEDFGDFGGPFFNEE